MVAIGRCAVGLSILTVALTGCGGSSHRLAAASHAALFAVTVSPPPSGAARLPGSTRGPMVCTVYDSSYATQVIFASQTFDVRAECRAWTRNRPGVGFLWGYQPARASTQPTESRQVCYMADGAGIVAARVIAANGLRPVSAVQAQRASAACARLLASGWVRQSGARHEGLTGS